MSDTRNHTTRDQLAAVLRENMSQGTSGRWIATYGITPEDFADAILASDAIAAVRAAAVAETTAAIEALAAKWERQEYKPGAFYPEAEAYADGRDNQAEACADEIREVLSGGRTALDTTLADAWDEGHKTRWRRGPDQCRCYAFSVGECGCGLYGTGELISLHENPYRADTGADQ